MRDLIDEIVEAHRDVQRRGAGDAELFAVTARRRYDAGVADVWDALTDPERLRRWFAPVKGDLRVGGAFQVEGNAGGEVQECDPPRTFAVTWGGPESVVRLRLTADGDGVTELELEHTVPVAFVGTGAGALYVGPGWDFAVLGLGRFLRGEEVEDPAAFEESPDGLRIAGASIAAWTEAITASGTATPEEVAAAVEGARAQFTPAQESST